MIEQNDEKNVLQKLMPLLELRFLLALNGHKERSDFIYLVNKGEKIELINWNGKTRVLTTSFKFTMMSLHPHKPLIAYIQDTDGNENYFIYTFDYESNTTKKLCNNSLDNITQIIWLQNDDLLFSGFNNTHYFISILKHDGKIISIYTTEKQILNMNYDHNNSLLAAAIGRNDTKIAIFDIKQMVFIKWMEEDNQRSNFPTINSNGYIAYSRDLPDYDELVIKDITSSNLIHKFKIPGTVGNSIFDEDAIQWIDNESLFLKIAKNAKISPYILNIKEGSWEGPLTNLSIEKAIVTKNEITWIGSQLNEGFSLELYSNNVLVKIINSEIIFNLSYESYWFSSFDKQNIHAWLVRTPNPQAPLLIYLHGGPTYAVRDSIEPFLLALALGGFTIFAINYRGSETFGAHYRDLNLGDMGGGDLLDVIYGVKFVKSLLGVKEPIRIFGESYGAYLALMALSEYPFDWSSGIAWGANIDLTYAYQTANSHYKSFYKNFLGGTPEEKPLLYKERSPKTLIRNLKAPTLIIHGKNDSRIPIEPLQDLMEYAKKNFLPIECLINNDGHSSRDVDNVVKNIISSILHLKNNVSEKEK